MGDIISRADAIEAIYKILWDEPPYSDSEALCREYAKKIVDALPSADAPTGDLISRADALAYPIRIDHYDTEHGNLHFVLGIESVMEYIEHLPSAVCDDCIWHVCNYNKVDWDADVVDSDDLIIKGAKGIQDGLYNIKDGKLFEYKAKGGTVRTYEIMSSAEAVQGWIPCSERLPSESGDYLCTIPLDADETYTDVLTFYKGKFYEDDIDEWGALYHDDVLAWMPLPTPYKESEVEE